MRILHIIGKRPKGGIGTVVKNYQKYISCYNIKFDYLLFDDNENGDFDQIVKGMGSNVYVLPELKHKRIFILRKSIKNFFREHKKDYDIIELHSPNIAFLIHKYAYKYGVYHRITHSHSIKLSNSKIKALRNKILCLSIKSLSTEYFACSKEAGSALFGKKVLNDNKFHIINNAINLLDFKFDNSNRNLWRDRCRIKDDEICLIHVGRFSKEKNHQFLLKICQKLEERHVKYKMILVGSGEYYDRIKNEASLHNLEQKIIFTGHISNVKDYLDAADIFLLPSFMEGVPLSIIEAQANGLECIISNTVPKVITSNYCYYLPLNVNDWVENIVIRNKTIINRDDAIQNLKKLGFDISNEAKKLSILYECICNKKK